MKNVNILMREQIFYYNDTIPTDHSADKVALSSVIKEKLPTSKYEMKFKNIISRMA